VKELEIIKKYIETSDNLTDLGKRHMKWLVGKVEELKKENWELNKEIGGYAGQLQDLSMKIDNLTEQMKSLTNKMFNA
jgi:uncharacterized coiled-coil DUF342 family protein